MSGICGFYIFFPSLPSNEQPLDPKMKHFIERLLHSPGLGTRCMEGEPLGWVQHSGSTSVEKSECIISNLERLTLIVKFGARSKGSCSPLKNHITSHFYDVAAGWPRFHDLTLTDPSCKNSHLNHFQLFRKLTID